MQKKSCFFEQKQSSPRPRKQSLIKNWIIKTLNNPKI